MAGVGEVKSSHGGISYQNNKRSNHTRVRLVAPMSLEETKRCRQQY